ncbi:MAG: glutathione S-transferase family protein [Thainema sp.]
MSPKPFNFSFRPRALPPGLIIRLGKWVWTTLWHLMMSRLAPRNQTGEYIRPQSEFRDRISADANSAYPAKCDRYHLIVGYGCPWAHRTLVVRALKGLENVIPVQVVQPSPDQGIWQFEAPFMDCQTLPELYQLAKPGYSGRSTVPVLWDQQKQAIVNNESAEIIEILNSAFNAFAESPEVELYPEVLRTEIDAWNDRIYPTVNNGVYRCGFAQTQSAYDKACDELFSTLDEVDRVLANQRYLCGNQLTLADARLFTTLFRFDIVYYGLFKCNRRRIQDYQHLGAYLRDLYQQPGVAKTCNLEAVKQDYYGNLFPLNPGGIIPNGPDISDLNAPHNRDRFGSASISTATNEVSK